MDYAKHFYQYLSALLTLLRQIWVNVTKLKETPVFFHVSDFILSLYFHYCGFSPRLVDVDHQTTVNFWISDHRRDDRPNLVLLHGCGGDTRWQFFLQVKSLSKSFNIYMPDLLFFGKSHSKSTDRTARFQAKCVMEGLKKGFGVDKCSVYSISYGGWVGYRMAEMYPQEVEANVIVSSGVGATYDQILNELSKLGKRVQEVVVPRDPDGFRFLMKRSIHKYNLSWIPDYFLWEFIKADKYLKEKEELIDHIVSGSGEACPQLITLSQKTLLVWGKEDKIFPKYMGYQLERLLGPNARLEILEGTGHAVNIDSPNELNDLIRSFILDQVS